MTLLCLLFIGVFDAGPASSNFSFSGGVEIEAGVISSQLQPNGLDGLTQIRPMFSFAHRDDFIFKLAPLFRFRVFDAEASNRNEDIFSILRGQDFDELSDVGSVIEDLRVNQRGDRFFLQLKPATHKTLGLGHLLRRYSARENADYRPASASISGTISPIKIELFASDIFGLRLFALDARLNVGTLISNTPNDRFSVSVGVAYDAALASVPFKPGVTFSSTPVAIANLDLSLLLFRNERFGIVALASGGSRFDMPGFGALFGLASDIHVNEFLISLKAEGRFISQGHFRFSFFAPTYEIARFSDIGFAFSQIGITSLPATGTIDGEIKISAPNIFLFETHVEHFLFGRTDVDAALELSLISQRLFLQAQFATVGISQAPRFHFSGGFKLRLLSGLYFSSSAATMLTPQSDSRILRGFTVSAGFGFDLSSRN